MSRYKRRDIERKMSSRSFDDYAATESGLPMEEAPANYTHGGRKPFSPIEELEEPLSEEMYSLAAAAAGSTPQGDERGGGRVHHQGYHDNSRRTTTTSPRTSTSPKQPSLSPQSHSSGSSGHSSPRSPPTGYAHPPPPMSQPPPLPPTAVPSRAVLSGTSKGRQGHVVSDPYGRRTGGGAYEVRHMTHQDQHHNRRVGGVGKSQHGSDSHVPFQQQQQHKDNSRVSSHSSSKVSRQSFHVATSDGNASYGSSVVNTRVVPSKKYATSISDHSPTERPSNPPQLADYYSSQAPATNESLNDPGDRIPPSGASSPSSTPNSTLSKLHHHQIQQEVLQSSSSDSRLLRTDSQSSGDSGTSSLEASKSDVILYHDSSFGGTPNGTTKMHVSLSGQNTMNMKHVVKTPGVGKEREKQSSLASVYNKYHPATLATNVGGDSSPGQPRLQQHSRMSGVATGSVAAKAAMFSLNLNNSGNTAPTTSDSSSHGQPPSLQESSSAHHTSPAKSSSKGVKASSPKTATRSPETGSSGVNDNYSGGQTSLTDNMVDVGNHDNKRGMDSRSSSIEELSQINEKEAEQEEGEEEVDGGRHALLIKPEATKSIASTSIPTHHMSGYGKHQQPHPQQGPPPPAYPPSSQAPPPPPPPQAAAPPQMQQHSHHHSSHHHSSEPHHPPPPPYHPPYMFTTNPSQGATSLSQPLSQGGGGGGGGMGLPLSQGLPPNYQSYEQHYPGRSEMAAMYPQPPPPSMGGGGKYGGRSVPRQHHHISPPHGSQQYEQQAPPQGPPYPGGTQQQAKHQSVSYQMSHDSRSGVHMMNSGQQLPPHLVSHDIPLHHRSVPYLMSNVVSLAHDAAGKGDVNSLHHMISKGEMDGYGFTEHYFTLAHKAAMHGRLNVLKFLIKEGNLPLVALQQPDDSLTTPAMLAIQGGHLECLQWLVEEGKVPVEVRDTGGETLVHHAAYHGQVKCLEWLLTTIPKDEKKEILDELGVTPAHFAAQGGHLDCLLLLMDRGYSIIHADKDNQRPLDWADAMGQYICQRFLIMYEACWSLSREISQMQKKNAHLQETLALMEQDHQLAINKMQQTHDDRIAKMREHYVDFTHSILTLKDSTPSSGAGQTSGGGASTSGSGNSKPKNQQPARKAPAEPPSTSSSQQRRTRPPVPPDAKKRSGRGGASGSHDGKKERGVSSHDGPGDVDQHEGNIDYRTATPQEVLEKRVTSVTQRMTASREARKHRGGHVTRTFSPLTPIIQRLYSGKTDEDSKASERSMRSQRQTEERRSAPKVKFSTTVTEYPHDYMRYDHSEETTRAGKSSGHSPSHSSSSSSGHSSGDHGNNRSSKSSSGHSPSHGPSSNALMYNSNDHGYNASDGYSKSERRPGS